MLNNRIKEQELFMFNKQLEIEDLKKKFDIALLNKVWQLENAYREDKAPHLSNADKREHEAMKDTELSDMKKKIVNMQRELDVMKIETDYSKREFNLRLSSQEDLQEIRLELKTLNEHMKRIGDMINARI